MVSEVKRRFHDAGERWLASLPSQLDKLVDRWCLELVEPFESCNVSFVSRVLLRDGTSAVLKIPYKADQAEFEAAALSFWAGDGAVRLLRCDVETAAMLIEACEPGEELWNMADREAADDIIVELFDRFRRPLASSGGFPMLADAMSRRSERAGEHFARLGEPFDRGLLEMAQGFVADLAIGPQEEVLLHGDLHGGNVLSSSRKPWLTVDPFPYVGDVSYNLVQYELARRGDMLDPDAELPDQLRAIGAKARVDPSRVGQWAVARLVFDALLTYEWIGDIKHTDLEAAGQFLRAMGMRQGASIGDG